MSATIDNSRFRHIAPGIEHIHRSLSLPRHRHLHGYATIVLAGCLEESGYNGRIRATAGDVLIHPALDCHGNQLVSAGAKLIRLPWFDESGVGGVYHLADVEELARTAEKDVLEAKEVLKCALEHKCGRSYGERNDWPDLLLAELKRNDSTEIGVWAEANGLARETISRGFAAAYGVVPSALRAELRACSAWLRIVRTSKCLSSIAADTGFSDQAHMTRWVCRITGTTPAVWRRNASELRIGHC